MNEQAILDELLDLAEQLEIEVRQDYLGGDGSGLCRLKSKWIFYLDRQSSLGDQIAAVAEALAGMEAVENIYLPPQVRDLIEQFKEG